MKMRRLRYSPEGYVIILPQDDLETVVDLLVATEYGEDFCLAVDFRPAAIAAFMEAGFLVMSTELGPPPPEPREPPRYLLLPKLHLLRSVLSFEELHVKRSIRRLLPRYELRVDEDFDRILERCVAVHGNEWLTPPLQEGLRAIRADRGLRARPISFGVYRGGELRAGEFGVMVGGVYTSYSGYHDETNAGTVQIILMAQRLQRGGFAFVDLGMPLDYKDLLGARNLDPRRFVQRFRQARNWAPELGAGSGL